MDCRAVLILLCVLAAHGSCTPLTPKTQAIRSTIQMIRAEIQTTLGMLPVHELPPNLCPSLNIPELYGLRQTPLSTQNLSSFGCIMLKMPHLSPSVSSQLSLICQYIQSVGQRVHRDCSLPPLDQDMDSYVHVRCLLQLLDQVLSTAK